MSNTALISVRKVCQTLLHTCWHQFVLYACVLVLVCMCACKLVSLCPNTHTHRHVHTHLLPPPLAMQCWQTIVMLLGCALQLPFAVSQASVVAAAAAAAAAAAPHLHDWQCQRTHQTRQCPACTASTLYMMTNATAQWRHEEHVSFPTEASP